MKEEIFYTDPVQKIQYYRRGGDTIYAYFSCDGRRHRFSTRTSDFQQAVEMANQKRAEARNGIDIRVKTISQVYKEFIAYKRLQGRAQSTLDDYEVTVRFLYEMFGKDRDVSSIKKKDISDLVAWRSSYYIDHDTLQQKYKRKGKTVKGKNYKEEYASNRTINKTVGLLISILRFACYEREYITSDKIPSFTRLSEDVRNEFVTETECNLLYVYLLDNNMLYQAYVVLFCFHSGCRYPNELNKLKWQDIDFENGVIFFMNRKSKSRKVINTRFPMFPVLREVLEELNEWYPKSKPEDLVFRNEKGRQIKNIRKAFKGAIEACGLEDKINSMYGLRHSFATHWIHTKMPLNGIAHLMGHADTVMLERRYAHLVSDKVNEHFQSAYTSMNQDRDISIIEKSKTRTIFDEDGLEPYRQKIRGEFIPPVVEKTM